jgi:hypothetical protein
MSNINYYSPLFRLNEAIYFMIPEENSEGEKASAMLFRELVGDFCHKSICFCKVAAINIRESPANRRKSFEKGD